MLLVHSFTAEIAHNFMQMKHGRNDFARLFPQPKKIYDLFELYSQLTKNKVVKSVAVNFKRHFTNHVTLLCNDS